MHAVCITAAFERAAHGAGMTDDEVMELVDYIAANPEAGDIIQGSGGCRKLRFAGKGKGKSGAYRTITFFSGSRIPVFLITVFSKGEKSTLDQREVNHLKILTKDLLDVYASKAAVASDNPRQRRS